MTETPKSEQSPYPSRRSLRAAQNGPLSEAPAGAAAGAETPEQSRVASAPAPAAEPVAAEPVAVEPVPAAPLRRERRRVPEFARAEYVQVPSTPHVPSATVAPDPAPAEKPSVRRRIAGLAAAASVGGLVLTMALPLTQQAESTERGAAAQQKLFSEVSTDAMPASFADISAVDSEAAAPASFEYRADSVVNYPFKQKVMLTDPFGYRTAPVEQFHDAQDFAASEGTQIFAIAEGKVVEAGYANDGCGFGLKLEHEIDGQEVTSRYCHMQSDSHQLKEGDTVAMGDPVGKVGATGLAFGAHLHLAMRVEDKPVDPMPFISKYHRMTREQLAKKQQNPPTVEATTPGNGTVAAGETGTPASPTTAP